jgi:exodeoxyribonuclease V beta subunit
VRSSLFNLPTTPLPAGTTLIEASAGTGKTFTLAGLFLRLLLEHGISHRQLLIVTYTEAATAELRGRIRARLVEAQAAFAPEAQPDDPLFLELRKRLAGSDPDFRHAQATLAQSLIGFDETPIYTIHGFCQRVLHDRAFESGSLFDVELVTDPRPLLDELVGDWWRQTFAGTAGDSTASQTGFALAAGLAPAVLRKLLEETQRHPALQLVARATAAELPALLARLDAQFAEAAAVFAAGRHELRAHFGGEAKWATKEYRKDGAMDAAFASLAACFRGDAGADDYAAFARFAAGQLEQHTSRAKSKVPHQTPRHRFYELCSALTETQRELRGAWQLAFHAWAKDELPRRKHERKVQTFDDLLTRLDDTLCGPGGEALAAVVTQQYTAALIDEFQDTDPVQWRIFHRLFGGPDQRLFLIGDPKQAIYGFRGADVFTYLTAAAAAPHAHTLGMNWRSESGLVAAVNGIFGRHPCPFVVRDIAFQPTTAAGEADQAPFTENGTRSAPLQLWFWQAGEPLVKSKAEPLLAEMAATEIVRLLSPAASARLGERPIRPADIAVLVEGHRQAELVAQALRARGVPAVQQTQQGVFASEEAAQLQVLLTAIAEPDGESRLRAALATDLLGFDALKLEALARDEAAWAARREDFRAWLALWNTAGFLPMFRGLLQAQHVRRRWLTLPDGERRLTNLLHLAELLHAAATERRLGVNGLRQHLAHRCANADEAGDEELLRLERDDNAVQLVTIHRSKGLEYPVVFCPFSFRAAEPARSPKPDELILCHDRDRSATMLGDLGSPRREEHERLAAEERLAENVRLLYVALTRARNRCYFAWGDFANGTTAPDWLLTPPTLAAGVAPVEALAAAAEAMTAETKQAAAEDLASEVPAITVTPPPAPDPVAWTPAAESTASLAPRTFTGPIRRDWRVASFSWLAAGRRDESPDYDGDSAAAPAPPTLAEPGSIHAFPRGTEAGTCLHKVFERIDFASVTDAVLDGIARTALGEHGLSLDFAPTVTQLVRRTLAVPLSAGEPRLQLGNVRTNERLNELEFCFPLRRFSATDLRATLARHGATLPDGFPQALERLEFSPVEGVLRGFMDLVFRQQGRWWLVDWKSNWLGPRTEDYTPAAVAAEMAAHHYPLQYLLYTLALDRWLTLRIPGYDYARDFGGVRYLFLRGLDPARPELGMFADQPNPELMADLRGLLLATAEEVPE